jgi:hypothetical protein
MFDVDLNIKAFIDMGVKYGNFKSFLPINVYNLLDLIVNQT